MRVLYATHQFFPDYWSGTEQLTLMTAREIRRRGHAVRVFTGFPHKDPGPPSCRHDRYRYDGMTVDRFYHHPTCPPPGQHPMAAEYDNRYFAALFRKCLDDWRPDLVHCYHLQRLSASLLAVCHDMGVPVIVSATDFWPICPFNNLLLPDGGLCAGPDARAANCLRHIAARLPGRAAAMTARWMSDRALAPFLQLARRLDLPQFHWAAVRALTHRMAFLRRQFGGVALLLTSNRHMDTLLARNGIRARDNRMLPFGVDHGLVADPCPSRVDGAGHALVVGFIGTLMPHKGAHVLLQAAGQLPAEGRLRFRIYGDPHQNPAYVDRLRRLAAGDRRIQFCGPFPGHRIGEVLQELDLLVVPSVWYENTPLTILFAQLARTPVVASDLGGIHEVIRDGRNGCLFEMGNHRQLAAILADFAAGRLDSRRFAEQARPPLSIQAYADALAQYYAAVVGRSVAAAAGEEISHGERGSGRP